MVLQALKTIEQALNLANKTGAFTLQDSATIAQSLTIVSEFINSKTKEVNSEVVESTQETQETK